MSQTTEKHSRLSRFGRWVAELLLVFVGVYAAFWLNNYQQRQQDAERRDRILASIERTLRDGIESNKINRAQQEREAAKFRRALDAGEMPLPHPFVFTTDYSPGDFATMLQAGGIQLLDLGTEPHGAVSKIERRAACKISIKRFPSFTIRPQRNCEGGLRCIPKLWRKAEIC